MNNLAPLALLALLLASVAPLRAEQMAGDIDKTTLAEGPFAATADSLATYKCPEWFRDAKFGIWAHWGPQAVARQGDWYARNMYDGPGHLDNTGKPVEKAGGVYEYHLKHYGHPSQFGYKDIIPLWKAERWNPDQLMALYRKTGAKYFVSMGSHHDNFFLWNSSFHRWNSVRLGPHRDVVGEWQQAARKAGLRFGVSEHIARNSQWFGSSHGTDASGPLAGVPYDGNDPANQDLYGPAPIPGDTGWTTKDPQGQQHWMKALHEIIDVYHPDLIYSDSDLPFGNNRELGRTMLAHFYNQDIKKNAGKLEAVYNAKTDSKGAFVRDIERGVAERIEPYPWQTDTSIGDWYYRTGQKYMKPGEVVRMLIDIVSKNGNLLLNVVQTPEGDLEPDVLSVLDGIASWMDIHKEGIYGTRPWKVYGEGPFITAPKEKGAFAGLKDVPKKPFAPADFRFTASKDGTVLYAFDMAPPQGDLRIVSLAKDGKLADKPVAAVKLLGSDEKLAWKQESDALAIKQPAKVPSDYAVAFKIELAK